MKINMTCMSSHLESFGPYMGLVVKLSGHPLDGGSLELRVSKPTQEQCAAFVIGNRYEIDVPQMPDKVPS